MQPTKKLSPEFIGDCVIWSLFAPSNQTVSLRDVEYEGKIYRMKNNLFPFKISELATWECSHPDIKIQISMPHENRFAADWIANHRAELSPESLAVLNAGKSIYKIFYKNLLELNFPKYKIFDWDAGWYQIRMSLKEAGLMPENFSDVFKNLSKKIEPQIYELGFLRDEVEEF